jgi:hypothetical protein
VNERLDDFAADITTYGWIVMDVAANASPDPEFAYSIALFQTYRHPEIIVVGLRRDVGLRIINDVGRAVRDGRRSMAVARRGVRRVSCCATCSCGYAGASVGSRSGALTCRRREAMEDAS